MGNNEGARVPDPVSMLYGSMEPNERFGARRDQARRRRRRRRATLVGLVLVGVIAFAAGWQFRPARTHASTRHAAPIVKATPSAAVAGAMPRPLPVEIRGIHVTGALASLPGKLAEYAALRGQGLNTIVLDIKDEGGVVSFAPAGVRLPGADGPRARGRKPQDGGRPPA